MTPCPELSVVISVYNGEASIRATIESILDQTFRNFEIIVVNDGSSDGTLGVLEELSRRDDRVRIVNQSNTGLTQALINGCKLARGDYIARHDDGDVSHQTRFEQQVQLLRSSPKAVLVTCGTQFVAPDGERLHTVSYADSQLIENLQDVNSGRHVSHHGAVCFRRDAYKSVGGYRPEFVVAQDYDLWMRMFELGAFLSVREILYTACLSAGGISSLRKDTQMHAAKTIRAATRARRRGEPETEILVNWKSQLEHLSAKKSSRSTSSRQSDWFYFVGCLLRKNNPPAAEKYFERAVRANRLNFRARIRWLQCRLSSFGRNRVTG